MMNVDHIQQWRARGGEGRIGFELAYQVDGLRRYWKLREGDREAAEYILIRLVTILEVFVRITISSLIDADLKYVERAEPLLKGAKLDYGVAKGLHGRRVTLGELIAHSLSLNSAKAILAAYEPLVPGFRLGLDTITERWLEDKDQALPTILQDPKTTIATIDRVFEARHILVHELPQEPPFDIVEIDKIISEFGRFLNAIDWQLTAETKGYVPRTQAAMTARAGEEAAGEEIELADALARLEKQGEMNPERLKDSQFAWQAFAKADASLYASLAEGGSMESMLYSEHLAELTRARVATIEGWLSRNEGEL